MELSPDLPLYDGISGTKVSEDQDRKIEVLRDGLMDAARSRVEELGEEAVAGAACLLRGLHARQSNHCEAFLPWQQRSFWPSVVSWFL